MKYKLTAQELSSFFGQLGILIHSGISAVEGLHILLEESTTDTDRAIISPLINSMEETGSLSQSVKDAGIFPHLAVTYIKTGEETGCLDETLNSLAHYYRQEDEISGEIKSAVTYPLLMLGMMAVVILVLLVKVLPVFRQVFRQMGMEMNGFSEGLLNAGNTISQYSAVFLAFAVLLIGCVFFFCFHPEARKWITGILYRLPGLRDIPLSLDYSKMTQGLALGLRSGLSPETSLSLASEMTSHPIVRERLSRTSSFLDEGMPFSQALIQSGLFGGMEGRLLSVAFQSGTADESLTDLADRYQEKSLEMIYQAISVVEPTIVIFLSLLVGLVLLSVMMPLLGILSDIAV